MARSVSIPDSDIDKTKELATALKVKFENTNVPEDVETLVKALLGLFTNQKMLYACFENQSKADYEAWEKDHPDNHTELLQVVWLGVWLTAGGAKRVDGKQAHEDSFVQARITSLALTLLEMRLAGKVDANYEAKLKELDTWGTYLVGKCAGNGKQKLQTNLQTVKSVLS